MGLFGQVLGIAGATVGAIYGGPAGAAAGYSIGSGVGGMFNAEEDLDYNGMFDSQAAMYREELNRRNIDFGINDKVSSNTAGVTLLTGDNKPVGQGSAAGANFQALQDEYAKMVAGTSLDQAFNDSNLAGLSGDTLEAQKRVNQQVKDKFNRDLSAAIGSMQIGAI